MKLADWLAEREIRPAEFARRIGVHRMTVLRWLDPSDDDPLSRPSWRQLCKVFVATGGQVTPNDFLPEYVFEELRRKQHQAASLADAA